MKIPLKYSILMACYTHIVIYKRLQIPYPKTLLDNIEEILKSDLLTVTEKVNLRSSLYPFPRILK
jgi:hypothetical protein